MPNKLDSLSKRHLNADERRALRTAELQSFAKQYARKAQRGVEPNDRRYKRDVERALKHLKPDELDRLLRDGEE